jgi:hypothetical protein
VEDLIKLPLFQCLPHLLHPVVGIRCEGGLRELEETEQEEVPEQGTETPQEETTAWPLSFFYHFLADKMLMSILPAIFVIPSEPQSNSAERWTDLGR